MNHREPTHYYLILLKLCQRYPANIKNRYFFRWWRLNPSNAKGYFWSHLLNLTVFFNNLDLAEMLFSHQNCASHPSLRILKLHKWPFKQRYVAGSAKCSTKSLSKLLICIQSAVKTGLQSYCDTTLKICYSTYNLGCSPPAISIKHLTSLPSTQLLLYLIWRTN